VHLSSNASLIKIPDFGRRIEFIGDSLTSGYSASYEALSGFGYNIGAGLGDTEFSMTAYPGICLHDANCWGNPRGQEYQWFRTSDTSPRAKSTYNSTPPLWDFTSQPAADIVIINIGTNDQNKANPVTTAQYLQSYMEFIPKVHAVYPNAQIIIMGLWGTFSKVGATWVQNPVFVDEIYSVYKKYESEGYVHYFNSTGILQHNDISPRSHPTDVGYIKVCSSPSTSLGKRGVRLKAFFDDGMRLTCMMQVAAHVIQYIRIKFGWELAATGPEVQHETLYWNDQVNY